MKRIHARRARGESCCGGSAISDPVLGRLRDVPPPGGLPRSMAVPAEAEPEPDPDRLPPPWQFGDDPEYGGAARRWLQGGLFDEEGGGG
jgi:hypothetical protein